jgi:UDPglucose--hexose-1-phosphate uridylyltransferase
LSGRLVAVAPGRAARPGAARALVGAPGAEEISACPFCEGRESLTPPEALALGRKFSEPDAPGWSVRVVPNLYPALERQEVVVHAPHHAVSIAELEDGELALVARAWSERAAAARADGFPYVQALLNEGREAGASRSHSHSQLVWLRERPPVVGVEDALAGSECAACSFLRDEVGEETRLVLRRGKVVALAAYAGRLPYELLVAPVEHPAASAFEDSRLADALALLAEAVRRLRALEGAVPLNAWVHDGNHWHVELVPRLTVLAGLELGAGIYVNSLAPEEAAERLRAAQPS